MKDNLFSIPIKLEGLTSDSVKLSELGWSFYHGHSPCFDCSGDKHILFAYNKDKTALAVGQFIVSRENLFSEVAKVVAEFLSHNGLGMHFINVQHGLPVGAGRILPGIDLNNSSSAVFTFINEEDEKLAKISNLSGSKCMEAGIFPRDNLDEIAENTRNLFLRSLASDEAQKIIKSYSDGSNDVELNSKRQSLVLSNDDKKP